MIIKKMICKKNIDKKEKINKKTDKQKQNTITQNTQNKETNNNKCKIRKQYLNKNIINENSIKLKFLIWNINGLNHKKIMKIQSYMKLINIDIFILIESHKNATKYNWNNWNVFYLDSNKEKTKGFYILWKKKLKLEIKEINSRALSLSTTIISKENNHTYLNILILYAHANTKKERLTWWENLNIQQYNIIMGDFNLVLDKERDRINTTSNSKTSVKVLNYLKEVLNEDYHDIAILKDNLQMTYYHLNKPCSRLDRIYVKKEICEIVQDYNVIHNSIKDHQPLLLKLSGKSKCTNNKQQRKTKYINKNKYSEQVWNTISNLEIENTWFDTKRILITKINEIQQNNKSKLQRDIKKVKKLIKKIPKNKKNKLKKYQEKLRNIVNETSFKLEAFRGIGDLKDKDRASKQLKEKILPKPPLEKILSIKNNKGIIEYDHKGISEAFKQFYEDLYGYFEIKEELLRNTLLKYWIIDENYQELADIVTKIKIEELKACLKTRKNHSAPGIDNMNYKIMKKMNDNALNQLINIFNNILEGKENYPEDWDIGIIITIHKGGDKLEIKNRRPITLLTTDYKLFTKILVDRLKKFLPNLILVNQVGFVPLRFGFDNIIILDQLIKEKNIILSIDIEKAFDSVSHKTISIILNHLKFPKNFIDIIANFLSNAKAQIKINNKLTETIKIKKGTRQGDPISPILFNLIIELLQRIAHNSNMTDAPTLNNIKVPILMFADDTAIISKSIKGIENWLIILEKFYQMTGLRINKTKSNILNNNKIPATFNKIPIVEKIKYLGFWFSDKGIINNNEQLLIDINNYAEKLFLPTNNIFRKTTILSTFILSKVWYQSYLYNMDYKKVNNIITNFLWSKNKYNTKKETLVSLVRLCQPINQGGLNIPNIKIQQTFLRARLGYKLLQSSKIKNIWSDIFNKKTILKLIKNRNIEKINKSSIIKQNNISSENTPISLLNIIKAMTKAIMDPLENIENTKKNFQLALKEDLSTKTMKENITIQLKRKDNRNKLDKDNVIIEKSKEVQIKYTIRQVLFKNNGINIEEIFQKSKNYTNRKLASFMWRFIQGALPFNHKSDCSHCKSPNVSYNHIFFECNSSKIFQKEANKIIDELKIEKKCTSIKILHTESNNSKKLHKNSLNFNWDQITILKFIAESNIYHPIIAIILSTLELIWSNYINKQRKEKEILNINQTIKRVITRTLNSFIKSLKSTPTTQKMDFIKDKWSLSSNFIPINRYYKLKSATPSLISPTSTIKTKPKSIISLLLRNTQNPISNS